MLKFSEMEVSTEFLVCISKNRIKGRPKTSNLYKRYNESKLNKKKRKLFVEAYMELAENGWLNEFVNIHGDMSHNFHTCNMMNGSCDVIGSYRFLPWHRIYLLKFEQQLQTLDKSLFVPFWRWTKIRRFPKWLNEVKPTGMKNRMGKSYDVTRDIQSPDRLPTKDDIKSRMALDNFEDFTLALEGMNPRGAHNRVHSWVGGTMNTMYSPADPIFWLHHAECDRLWYSWQVKHPMEHPPLTGSDAILTPWDERYSDIADLHNLPYFYRQLKV